MAAQPANYNHTPGPPISPVHSKFNFIAFAPPPGTRHKATQPPARESSASIPILIQYVHFCQRACRLDPTVAAEQSSSPVQSSPATSRSPARHPIRPLSSTVHPSLHSFIHPNQSSATALNSPQFANSRLSQLLACINSRTATNVGSKTLEKSHLASSPSFQFSSLSLRPVLFFPTLPVRTSPPPLLPPLLRAPSHSRSRTRPAPPPIHLRLRLRRTIRYKSCTSSHNPPDTRPLPTSPISLTPPRPTANLPDQPNPTSPMSKMYHLLFLSALLLLLPLSLAQAAVQTSRAACLGQLRLVCIFSATTGNTGRGRVIFSPIWRPDRTFNKCLVGIEGSFFNLSTGRHGFHIHTYGDLTASDGTSTGGHFTNPRGTDIAHGYPRSPVRHWGDFANLVADADGKATYSRVDTMITLRGIVGRGMIIHELRDMGPEFQPTGSAGSRQAACVIGFANPEL